MKKINANRFGTSAYRFVGRLRQSIQQQSTGGEHQHRHFAVRVWVNFCRTR